MRIRRQHIYLISHTLLLLMWTYAALSKLLDFDLNVHQMHNQIFPIWIADLLSYAIPFSELLIVILLLMNRTLWLGFASSSFLLFIFTIYIIFTLSHFFARIPCSCGGIISSLTWTQHLFFNSFFLILSLFGLIYQLKQERRLLGNIP
jgi:putative oxidoreductase